MVLNLAISLIKLIINSLVYFFALSSNIGRCLIFMSQELYYKIKDTITAVNVFKDDVVDFLNTLKESLAEMNNNTHSCIGMMLKMFIELGDSANNAIAGFCYASCSFICYVNDTIYNTLKSIWLGLIFGPRTLYNLLTTICGALITFVPSVSKILIQCFLTIIESTVFIIMFLGCIAFYIVYFRHVNLVIKILLKRIIKITLMTFKSLFIRLCQISKIFGFNQIRGIFPETSQKSYVTRYDDEEIETLMAATVCVLCYERKRKILLLPCRHLCLCEECKTSLILQSPYNIVPCPICRTPIRSHIVVYT